MTRPSARPFARLAGLFLAVLAAGCDEGPASNVRFMHPSGAWQFLVHATDSGPLLLEIHGQAFDGARTEEVEAMVQALMSEAQNRRLVRFTRDPAMAARPAYRVVLVFNGGKGLDSAALCAEPAAGGPPAGERIELLASFCHDGSLLSSVHAWMAAAADTDRRFRQLIQQTTRELFADAGPER